MHDDLIDAVEWAHQEGIADPDRVAIMGGSYGGYATLWGMTNTPEDICLWCRYCRSLEPDNIIRVNPGILAACS